MLNANNINGGVETTAQGEINPYCRFDRYRRVNTCLSAGLPNPCHMAWHRRRPVIRLQVTQRKSRLCSIVRLRCENTGKLPTGEANRELYGSRWQGGQMWGGFFHPLRLHTRTSAHILSKQNLFKHSLVQWKKELGKPINKSIKRLFPLEGSTSGVSLHFNFNALCSSCEDVRM